MPEKTVGGKGSRPRIRSAPFSPTMIVGALVLGGGTRGITRVFSEGGPRVGEKLVLAGLADEVIVSTASKTLGQPGVVAVRPGLAAALADPDLYALVEAGPIGQDRFEHFVRRG